MGCSSGSKLSQFYNTIQKVQGTFNLESSPAWVNNIKQLLCIQLLTGCEDHQLKKLRAALQETCHVGPLPHIHTVFLVVECHFKHKILLLPSPVQGAMDQGFVQIQDLSVRKPSAGTITSISPSSGLSCKSREAGAGTGIENQRLSIWM